MENVVLAERKRLSALFYEAKIKESMLSLNAKTRIAESVTDQLTNIPQIELSRHRCLVSFMVNRVGG
jgi:hypothetical protein